MTREEINVLHDIVDIYEKEDKYPLLKDKQIRTIKKAIQALEQEPCEDVISRQAVLDIIRFEYKWLLDAKGHNADTEIAFNGMKSKVADLPSGKPQESKTEQFAEWVATEIFDDMWEYNKDAFAELACRKLEKLGIVRAKGDEWELVNLQESEDSTIESDNKYEAKVITRGNCMMCGKKLTEGLFFCKECEGKGK